MNRNGALDNRTLDWLRKTMDLGCDMAVPVEKLRKHGFSDAAILAGIEAVRPRGNALAGGAPPLIRRNPENLRKVDNPDVDIYTLDNFLNAKECDRLIALIGHNLHPSKLALKYDDNMVRTSQTAELCHLRSPAALEIDAKICKKFGIRAGYSEGVQAQRYDVGQEFKPHVDFFEPDSDMYRRLAGLRGNRTWTFMVYLNDGMEGGATRFTEINHAVEPKAGMALFWNNLKADGLPNRLTRHCGEPVTRGHKIIITKWFRVHGDGPVFHEQGER